MIVSLFLFCAGIGQSMAVMQRQSWARFWRRWVQIAGCAGLVTLGSWLMYPQTFIYFGVLHGLALMLIIARLTATWGRWLWALGAVAIASKFIAAHALNMWASGPFAEVMNSPVLNWLGWITQKPNTEDYVPLFPWLGVMWWGVAAGAWLNTGQPGWLRNEPSRMFSQLAVLGRWGLPYYMLHQPVLMGTLMALAWLK